MTTREDDIARALQTAEICWRLFLDSMEQFQRACQAYNWKLSEDIRLRTSVNIDAHCDAFQAACKHMELMSNGE